MPREKTRKLFLHLYTAASGADGVQYYCMAQPGILRQHGLCWPCALPAANHPSPDHRHLCLLEWLSLNHPQESTRKQYAKHFATALHRMAAAVGGGDMLLSFPLSVRQWPSLWAGFREHFGCHSLTVHPLITLCAQEDDMEYRWREQLWHVLPSAMPVADATFDYADTLRLVVDSAEECGFTVAPPRIFWQAQQGPQAERETVHSVLDACGLPPSEAVEESCTLAAYDTLRFAALTLPHSGVQFAQSLGMEPAYLPTVGMTPQCRDIHRALHRVEAQGLVSTAPLSPAERRRRVRTRWAEGNVALLGRHPHLAPAMHAVPTYAAERAEGQEHPLEAASIDACLEFLDSQQKSFLRERLRHAYVRLNPEQELIVERLGPSTYPAQRRTRYEVSVLTLTCNQRTFISQCMDGVLAQEASFPVQHIVVDDGSDDGTRDIIDDYACRHPHILPVYLEHGTGNVRALFERCHSPFAALCDGDDYYDHPHKLQMQVDGLKAHADWGLCFHPVRVVYEDHSQPSRVYPSEGQLPRGVRASYYLADLLRANFIQTSGVMYRWRFGEGLPSWFAADIIPGDWYWHLLHAELGKIGYIDTVMSVYRRSSGSFYYSSEDRKDTTQHRLAHGMEELRAYHVINLHFQRRYERIIMSLANSVLFDFLQWSRSSGSDELLHRAGAAYPQFMRHFIDSMEAARRKQQG